MKALTLRQPWATLLAGGEKKIETRSWTTQHRGRVAIHASKAWEQADYDLSYLHVFARSLMRLGFDDPKGLPTGMIIGSGLLMDVKPTREVRGDVTMQEYSFGNYETGRWAWLFVDLVMFKVPVPCRGMQGLWTVPPEVFPLVDMNEGIAR
jgi:hypothetical protein